MRLLTALLVVALLGPVVRAEGSVASAAPKKEVQVVAALRDFYLAGAVLDGIDGTSEHFDVLTFRVITPDSLRKQSFAIWVRIPLVVETDESAKERGSYWSKLVGREIRVTLDERVFSEPSSFPCAFTCARDSLKFEEKPNQSLEPTPTAGTSAAEQPLVPAAVVAHL